MANMNQDWDDLGRNIQDIVDRAVNSHDYQKLNQTIRQAVGRAVDLGGEAVRKAVDSASVAAERNQPVQKQNLPVLYGSTGGRKAKGIVKIVGGGLLDCVTLVGLVSIAAIDMLSGGVSLLTLPGILTLGGFGAGLGLICSGVNTLGRVSRFQMYRKTLGQKTHCAVEKLARSVGKSVKFVRRELQRMIDEGLFLEGHLDHEQTSLITSHETYRHYESSRLQLEQRQREEAAEKAKKAASPIDSRVREVLDKGSAFIQEIRRCNDAIPGEAVSAKIDRMEQLVRRIFQRAETNPEIVPDLKKMMDYYLPMTVKLLNAYADMDAQPVQGQTIQASKREIEDSLDTLNLAFEKLLDELFADTAMDISSDISVLNTLLAQEGLTEDGISKINKQNV